MANTKTKYCIHLGIGFLVTGKDATSNPRCVFSPRICTRFGLAFFPVSTLDLPLRIVT